MHRIEAFSNFLGDRHLFGDGAVVGAAATVISSLRWGWKGRKLWVGGAQADAAASDGGRHCEALPLDRAVATADPSAGSMDFVYLDVGTDAKALTAALSTWWPRLRTGGVIAGGGYLDGEFRGASYGTRSVVDAFAAQHGLAVRLTLDSPPAWYAVKGEAPPATGSLKIGLLTAFDAVQRPLAHLSSPNKRAYCARHGHEFIERTSGFDAARHPVWGKIKFLRELLPRFDWLFWSDADSLILRPEVPLESFLPGEAEAADMVIGLEDMGVGIFHINAGQFFVRNGKWAMKFLADWYAQEHFEADALREQRALIHLIESRDLSRRVWLVPQRRFNAYPINYREGDFLLHFPDLPIAEKLRLMRAHLPESW
jgi:hypothetical protein